jgi:hypothetical protein
MLGIPIMRNSKVIVDILRQNNPPDVKNVDYRDKAKRIIPSLQNNAPIFCDNVIFWSIGTNKKAYVYRQCRYWFENSFCLTYLREGTLKNDDIAPEGTSYFSIKVSLSEVALEVILVAIQSIATDEVIVHDIDIAQDIDYITSRKDVENYILANGVKKEDIVNDRCKTGDNCISFFNHNRTLKVKVYNKYVQMLESCDVMTTLGSRLHSLFVDPIESIRNTLERTKEVGVTRIEVKFYDGTFDIDYFLEIFNATKNFLEGCTFYKTSLKYQWKQLVKRIHKDKVIMIYLKEKKTFAYCHWWNSITGKIQGGIAKGVSDEELPALIVNFSFNSMTSKLITVENQEITVYEYRRTSDAITLIPGPKGGLHPGIRAELNPHEVGIVDYRGINIGWPSTRIYKDSSPLAGIERIDNNDRLEDLYDHHVSHYIIGYNILTYGSQYKVIARGEIIFRGKEYLGAELIDKDRKVIKVRCGPSLEALIQSQTVKFHFKVISTVERISSGRDIKVKEV